MHPDKERQYHGKSTECPMGPTCRPYGTHWPQIVLSTDRLHISLSLHLNSSIQKFFKNKFIHSNYVHPLWKINFYRSWFFFMRESTKLYMERIVAERATSGGILLGRGVDPIIHVPIDYNWEIIHLCHGRVSPFHWG